MSISLVQSRQQRTRRLPKVNRQSSDFYPFGGGLNLIDSPLSSIPGQVQNALNYEIGFEGGYKRVGGYEVFDGVSSAADPQYWILPITATQKAWVHSTGAINANGESQYDKYQDERQTVWGLENGGRGEWLALDDSGGYGVNLVLRNTLIGLPTVAGLNGSKPDDRFWDDDPYVTGTAIQFAFDSDYRWPNGDKYGIPYLSRIEEEISGSGEHWLRSTGQAFTVAVGDILYFSCYAKYKFGHSALDSTASGNARGGIRLQLFGTGGAFGIADDPHVDFRIVNGSVHAQSLHVDEAGVDLLEDDVLRLWGRTRIATTAVATDCWFELAMMEDDTPTTLQIDYASAFTAYVHIGGMGMVKMPIGSPHNAVDGVVFDDTTVWEISNVTIVDADTAWASGRYPAFSKFLPDANSGTHRTNLNQRVNTWALPGRDQDFFGVIPIATGERISMEFYAKLEASGCDGIVINFLGIGIDINFSTGDFNVLTGINLRNGGTEYTTGDIGTNVGWETVDVEEVETDIFRIKLISIPFDLRGTTIHPYIYLCNDNADVTDYITQYDGTAGEYGLITGMRIWTSTEGQAPVLMIPKTNETSEEVRTGHIVLGGTAPGMYEDGEELMMWGYFGTGASGEQTEQMRKFGYARGPATLFDESDPTLDAAYRALAATAAGRVAHPEGSGPIRGVWMHKGVAFCVRDSWDGVNANLWQAGGAGWRRVGNLYEIPFSSGSVEPVFEDEVEDGTNGAEGLVRVAEVFSGTWAGGDATGVIYCDAYARADFVPDLFEDTNAIDNETTVSADVATVDATIGDGLIGHRALPAGGRYEFRSENLFGNTRQERMYFVNGVGRAFEYDPVWETLRPVITGMVEDVPTHLAVHNYHLFMSFKGGSVQLSGDGDPHAWTVITGATEIAVGDECTGFNEEVGNSLFIFTRNKSFVLQGNTRANFDLDDFNINAGAHEWSIQRIGLGMFFDDRGFTSLLQSQRAGSVNFQENAQSELIQPLVNDLVRNAEVTTSHLIRNENIYRCYFNDGRVVSIGFKQHEVAGHMLLQYPFVANVSCSQEDAQGAERVLVGTMDGEVFELERSTSFDSDPVRAFVRTVLYQSDTPGMMKKYDQCRLDGTFRGALNMTGRIEYDFNEPDFNLHDDLDFSNSSAGGYWDDMIWDEFIWDRATSGNPQVKLEGEGTNISVYLASTSTADLVHTLRGITLQWKPRRDDRRST